MKKLMVHSRVFQQDYSCREYKYFDVEVELEDDVYESLLKALEAAGDNGLQRGDEFPGHEIVTKVVYDYLDSIGQGNSTDKEMGHTWYDYIIGRYWQNMD